jgi:hypothetical protein
MPVIVTINTTTSQNSNMKDADEGNDETTSNEPTVTKTSSTAPATSLPPPPSPPSVIESTGTEMPSRVGPVEDGTKQSPGGEETAKAPVSDAEKVSTDQTATEGDASKPTLFETSTAVDTSAVENESEEEKKDVTDEEANTDQQLGKVGCLRYFPSPILFFLIVLFTPLFVFD